MPVKVEGMVRYFEGEPLPTCPCCMDPVDAGSFLPTYADREADDIECPHCGRVYTIVAHVRYAFDCYPKGFRPKGKEVSR